MYPSVSDINTILGWSIKAKEYLKGEPFIIKIYNYDADYVSVDAFVLDDDKKAENAILPDLFISKGESQIATFKANLFLKSQTDILFEILYKNKICSLLVKYIWKEIGVGSINLVAEMNGKEVKSSGNFFKRVLLSHPSGLDVVTFANGSTLQIGIGKFVVKNS